MNYLKIIWQGYFDEENDVLNMWGEHEYLENYFFKECKKAEKEFVEPVEFFEKCIHVVENLEDILVIGEKGFNDRKNELELLHNQAKKGLLQYENMEGKTIEQKRQETIEYCKHELASISETDHCINLEDLTSGQMRGILYKDDLLQIKLAIQNAFQKCERNSQQEAHQSPYSVLEWATIFYYADETKLLSDSNLKKERMKQFMSKHNVNTTFGNFKTKYYEAKKRINKKNDYPINKLKSIISFLKENYKQTVTKVENDIIIIEDERPE